MDKHMKVDSVSVLAARQSPAVQEIQGRASNKYL